MLLLREVSALVVLAAVLAGVCSASRYQEVVNVLAGGRFGPVMEGFACSCEWPPLTKAVVVSPMYSIDGFVGSMYSSFLS